MNKLLVIALLLVAGCEKSKPPEAQPTVVEVQVAPSATPPQNDVDLKFRRLEIKVNDLETQIKRIDEIDEN